MMVELLGTLTVALALALAFAAYLMWKMDKEAGELRFKLLDTDKALHRALNESNEMFLKWSESTRGFEERAIKSAARYHARTMQYEERVSASNARWIEAARQNANLAEQLATIRLAHPEAYSESEEHIESVSPSIPYSVELANWLSKFESPQAREIAMEQADMFRASGLDDSQIIDKLEEEWTA
jgi:hypothetical protein